MPRIGFTYELSDSMSLSGGVGLFSAVTPMSGIPIFTRTPTRRPFRPTNVMSISLHKTMYFVRAAFSLWPWLWCARFPRR